MNTISSYSTRKNFQVKYQLPNAKQIQSKLYKQIVFDLYNLENTSFDELKSIEVLDLLILEDNINEIAESKIQEFMNQFKIIKSIQLIIANNNQLQSQNFYKRLLGYIQLYNQLNSLSLQCGPNQLFDDSTILLLEQTFKSIQQIKVFKFEFPRSKVENKYISQTFSTFIYLKNLTKFHINLTNNLNVTNKDFICLSQILKQMNQLKEYSIIIEPNNLRNFGAQGLFSSLRSVPEVIKLQLIIHKGNYIQSDGYKQLSSSLAYLKNLEVLELEIGESEKLDSQMLKQLFKSIGSLPNLISLSIQLLITGSIPLTSDCIQQLEISFKNLKKLTHFDIKIENCKFQDSKLDKAFQKLFQNAKSLNSLQFNFNTSQKIKENIAISLIQSFSQLKSLKQLSFTIPQTQNLKGDFVKQLENVFKNLVGLQEFSLTIQEQTKIEEDHTKEFFDVLSMLSNLTILNLSIRERIFINENIIAYLFSSIRKLKNLEYLSFTSKDNTLIQQSGLKNIGQIFKPIEQLKQLHLSLGFNENGLKDLANQLIYLINLSTLCLEMSQSNNNHSTEIQQIICQIGSLTNLTELNLKLPFQQLEYKSIKSLNNTLQKLPHLKSLVLETSIVQNQPDNKDSLLYGIKFLDNLEEINLILDLDVTFYLRDQIEILCQITCLPKINQINLSLRSLHILETHRQKQPKTLLEMKFKDYYFAFSNRNKMQLSLKPEDLRIREDNFQLLKTIKYFNLNIESNNQLLDAQSLLDLFSNFKYLSQLKQFNIDVALQEDIGIDLLVGLVKSISSYSQLDHLNLKLKYHSESVDSQGIQIGNLFKNTIMNLNQLENISIEISNLKQFNFVDQMDILEAISEHGNINHAQTIFIGKFSVIFRKDKLTTDQMNIENQFNEDDIQNKNLVKQLNQNSSAQFFLNTIGKALDQDDLIKLNKFLSSTIFDQLVLNFLTQNQINQDLLFSFGESLKNQKRLLSLKFELQSTLLRDEIFECIVDGISKLEKLQILEFKVSDNHQSLYQALYFIGVAIIKEWQIQLKEFTYNISSHAFSLKNNQSSSYKILQITTSNDQLQTFDIISTQADLEQNLIDQLGKGLQKIPDIETIDLSVRYNNVESSYQDSLRYLQNLKSSLNIKNLKIYISQKNKQFSDEGKSLYKALQQFQNLQQLIISMQDHCSQLKDEGFSELIIALKNMRGLTKLSLSFYEEFKCNENSGVLFGQCISQMSNLKYLYLLDQGKNQLFDDNNSLIIAKSIKSLQNLQEIIINLTNFKNEEILVEFLYLIEHDNNQRISLLRLSLQSQLDIFFSSMPSSNQYKQFNQQIVGKNKQLINVIQRKEIIIPMKIFEVIQNTKEISILFTNNSFDNQKSLQFVENAVKSFEINKKEIPQMCLNFQIQYLLPNYLPKCLEQLINCKSLKLKILNQEKNISLTLQNIIYLSQLNVLYISIDLNSNKKAKSFIFSKLKRLVKISQI